MARDQIHVGDTPELRYLVKHGDAKVDVVTDVSSLRMRITAPTGGTSATVTPSVPSGETEIVSYQTLAATFDNSGQWKVAIEVNYTGGRRFESDLDIFEVHESQFP